MFAALALSAVADRFELEPTSENTIALTPNERTGLRKGAFDEGAKDSARGAGAPKVTFVLPYPPVRRQNQN